ncbi:MAG: hypothetical protein AB1782_12710 [Cyanobacteriota bacterium]
MVVRLGPSSTQTVLKLANMSPTMQRLIIGATGLISHTTIDALNPYVDKETRKYAAVRSAVKMFICTASGVLTREVGQKLGEWAVKNGKVAVPEGMSKIAFASSVGKVFAIVGAVASIFLIDVPFINKLLNLVMNKFINKKDKPAEKAPQVSNGGGKVNYNA